MTNKTRRAAAKVVGVIMIVAVLFIYVGKEVQAAKQIKWPYGTYVCNNKKVKSEFGGKLKLDWGWDEFGDYIRIIPPSYLGAGDDFSLYKVGTNKYRSKAIRGNKNHYLIIIVSKTKLVMKEHMGGDEPYYCRYTYAKLNFTFKLKKHLSRNVG